MARIHANLRRTATEQRPPAQPVSTADLVCGEIEVFFNAHEVRCRGKVLDLTAREYEILRYMASNANRVIPREELMEKVWGYEYYGDLRAVDVAICRVRDKVEEDPSTPKYIITRRGVVICFQRKLDEFTYIETIGAGRHICCPDAAPYSGETS